MPHVIEPDDPVLVPDDGLLLGNGDLSVSVYQAADTIIFRFGKGDVWDRRLDLSDSPRPAHIDELARGIRDEGWKCGPYGGPVQATRTPAADPQRMLEITQGVSSAYSQRPFPCPKPIGELALHLPIDLAGLRVRQRLTLQTGLLEIICTSDSGVRIEVEAFVPPSPNLLVIRWKRTGWDIQRTVAPGRPPVWFSLYRWADPSVAAFAAAFKAQNANGAFDRNIHPKSTPLAPPVSALDDGRHYIEQAFAPDPLFPEGFRYRLVPLMGTFAATPVPLEATREARLHLRPPDSRSWDRESDFIAVHVPTTSDDPAGPAGPMRRVAAAFAADPAAAVEGWRAAALESARDFWSRSSVETADPVFDSAWHETLHARRCCFRAGAVPPGLYLPSSIRDYSLWHGDYHTNYNVQSPFWGDLASNHVEDLADAWDDMMRFFFQIGRKIARDYFSCRGVFVQLSGYPIHCEDDPIGVVPMGRMAYMTGWVANHYWWRYLHTLDADWLARVGYPAIRDCALFYTDFLHLGPDGLYHAFPSNQGEDGLTGDADSCTDRPQVMRHMRYCLRAAIAAAELLDLDPDLRVAWRDRVDRSAPDNPPTRWDLGHLTPELARVIPPEFFSPDGGPHPLDNPAKLEIRFTADPLAPSPWASRENTPDNRYMWSLSTWYFGKVPWYLMIFLRHGLFAPERDWPHVRDLLVRWRRPNGLFTAMAVGGFGNLGAWSESLGLVAPLQEMLLQSWKGWIHLFPAWPEHFNARFTTLRAEGAFLVSAAWRDGRPQDVRILSEMGAPCRVQAPWPGPIAVHDSQGRSVPVTVEDHSAPARIGAPPGRVIRFQTSPGEHFTLTPAAGANSASTT